MSDLDNLANIDRTIGFPLGRGSGIITVLEELDKDGVSIKDGFGEAPRPFFSGEEDIPLMGTTPLKSTLGADLLLFYSSSCVFSNFFPSPMTVDGREFLSSEQYFMWIKAKTFKDEEKAEEILSAGSPAEAKKLGRQVRNFKEEEWKGTSNRMMTVACYRKFQQNRALRKALFSTAGAVLVEASPRDRIWGIGMGASNVHAADPSKWRGSNKLGRILTVIREHMISSKFLAMLPITPHISAFLFVEFLNCLFYLLIILILSKSNELLLKTPFFKLFYSTGKCNAR
ncbi:hypothetical protein PENTCL1PPCAC_17430 [Pristionchus entomophagus]|uniref:NADAR domain-containing protein n=1 Tax=Pristionchus entomophagus TaxID=358040 RepID=A0AAV5TLE5_9BILA|nr:hypothetical protein PENTCL1PPCAC_17430 [Pristionchus entomophagus]